MVPRNGSDVRPTSMSTADHRAKQATHSHDPESTRKKRNAVSSGREGIGIRTWDDPCVVFEAESLHITLSVPGLQGRGCG